MEARLPNVVREAMRLLRPFWPLALFAALLALASLALGAGINIVAKRGWIRDYEGARAAQDDLHKQYRAITDGAKRVEDQPRAARARPWRAAVGRGQGGHFALAGGGALEK